jgi:hypothetical protein
MTPTSLTLPKARRSGARLAEPQHVTPESDEDRAPRASRRLVRASGAGGLDFLREAMPFEYADRYGFLIELPHDTGEQRTVGLKAPAVL